MLRRVLSCAWAGLWLLGAACDRSARPPLVSGTIETDEAHLASRYGGRVQAIHVREGETLKAGQLILELEAPELASRREMAEAVLAELKAGARPEELAAAKHDWEAVQAELKYARLEFQRAADLFGKNTISQAERDRAETRAQALEKSEAAARSRYELLAAGARRERIQQAEAQLAEIITQIAEMKLVAASNCVLETLHVRVGDVLAANRPAATVLLTSHLWLRVFVPEPWLGNIRLDMPVEVRVDSAPKKTFRGTVEQINRAAEFTPRNVQTAEDRVKQVFGVKIRLPAEGGELRAGMSADVLFPPEVTRAANP